MGLRRRPEGIWPAFMGIVLVVAACGSTATTAPTAPPATAKPVATPTAAPAVTPVPATAAPTAAPTAEVTAAPTPEVTPATTPEVTPEVTTAPEATASPVPTAAPTVPEGATEINFWSWVPGIQDQVNAWNAANPTIFVNYINEGAGNGEYTALKTALEANSDIPDVVQIEYQHLPGFIAHGDLADLSQFGANDVKDQFVPWTWAQVSQGAGVYAYPEDAGPMVMMCNQQLLDKNNIKAPTTWAEFTTASTALHAADPNSYLSNFTADQGHFFGLLWQSGATPFKVDGQNITINFTSPEVTRVAKLWGDLITSGNLSPTDTFTPDWQTAIGNGSIACWTAGAWGPGVIEPAAPTLAGKWQMYLMPQWAAGDKVNGNYGGSTIAVTAKSTHQAEAEKFDRWLNTDAPTALQLANGIVGHAGADNRVFREAAELGAELAGLGGSLRGGTMPSRAALVFEWPNAWALEFRPALSQELDAMEEALHWYAALWRAKVAVDVISARTPLDGYDLVVAPLLYLVTRDQAAAIERFVDRGGTFVTGFFSGVVDEDGRAWPGGAPGPLKRTLGIAVEEVDPMVPSQRNRIVQAGEEDGPPFACRRWQELLRLDGARPLATFGDDYVAGAPAVTEHLLGTGRALYVATHPDDGFLDRFLGGLLHDLGIGPPFAVPPEVEITRRVSGDQSVTFLLNHARDAATVVLPTPMRDLLTGRAHAGRIELSARGVAALVAAG